jgi:MFS transporter, DHA2 family, multidrug resistance protein
MSGTVTVDRNKLLLGLGFATGMEFYIADSMNLVLPDIAGTLGVGTDEASWLLTTYSCALFLGVPVSIWMAGHIGYKRYLLGTITLFAGASLSCALAPEFQVLLACRAVQGFAGAGLVMWWRASIYLLMPKPQRSPSLMRVSTMLYLFSAAGLLASGWITDHLDWHLIFAPIILFAIVATWFLWRYFPDLPRPAADRLVRADIAGILLLGTAVVSLQIILSRGPVDDWLGSAHLRALAWVSVVSLAAFIAWQASHFNRTPLLDIPLLRDRAVLSSVLLGIFTGMILSGSLYALPEYLRNIDPRHLSALQAAEVMCAYAIVAALIRPAMVEVIARIGQRAAILLALILLVVSMLWFSRVLTSGTPNIAYLAPLVLYAFCLAPLLPAVGSGTVARIEQGRLLDGVSLYMTFRQFGASLGVAGLNALIDARETYHSSRLFEHIRANHPLTHGWVGHLISVAAERGDATAWEAHRIALKLLQQTAATQSATLAYADAFVAMAAVGCATILLLPMVPASPPTKKLFG